MAYREAHAAVVNALDMLSPLLDLKDILATAAEAEAHIANSQAVLADLNGQIEQANAALSAVIDKGAKEMEERQNDLAEMNRKWNERVTFWQARVATAKEEHAATVTRLAEEAKQAADAHQQAMAELDVKYQAAAGELQKKQAQVRQAKAQLDEVRATVGVK